MKLIVDKLKNGMPNDEFNRHLKSAVVKTEFTEESANELKEILKNALELHGGWGISANQLGINKRACFIKLDDTELFLVNPYITERNKDGFIFYEACLSMPKTKNQPIRTLRANSVKVNSDNLGEMEFAINPEGDKESVSMETLLTVIVQHEIDHLDGVTIRDRMYNEQVVRRISYGRNDKIIMKSPDGELVEVKYKRANDYYLKGYEIV